MWRRQLGVPCDPLGRPLIVAIPRMLTTRSARRLRLWRLHLGAYLRRLAMLLRWLYLRRLLLRRLVMLLWRLHLRRLLMLLRRLLMLLWRLCLRRLLMLRWLALRLMLLRWLALRLLLLRRLPLALGLRLPRLVAVLLMLLLIAIIRQSLAHAEPPQHNRAAQPARHRFAQSDAKE